MTWRLCRVYVVDLDPMALQHTAHLLRSRDFTVEPQPSPADFLAQLDILKSGCVVIDPLSPAVDLGAVTQRLYPVAARMPFIALTDSDCQSAAVDAMRAGAIDLLRRPADPARLAAAIRVGCARVAHAEHEETTRRRLAARLAPLTAREQEVLAGLARGRPNKGIARDLGISDRTVEVHRASLMQKLDAPSLADALRVAFEAERLLPSALPAPAIHDWRDQPGRAKVTQT